MSIAIYHNIRWSRYKAAVFSSIHEQALRTGVDVTFFQIADTDGQRTALSGVDVACHRYPHALMFEGSYSQIPKPRLIGKLFHSVYTSRADLVVLPGYDKVEYWAMLLAAVMCGKRRAVFCDSTLRDRRQSPVKGLMKRLFFRACDGFFAYGSRSAELLRHYGASPSRIYGRCQAAALPKSYSPDVARRRRVDSRDDLRSPLFLYVGRLSEEKSLDVLLRAFAMTLTKWPEARLLLVGAGPADAALRRLALALGIADSVEFTGSRNADELQYFFARATCLVLPSRSEPWGLVVNEALHHGCPVLVSDSCGCVPELVQEEITGLVFRTDDIYDLSRKLSISVEIFSDAAWVADQCLGLIAAYTPERAAAEILRGSAMILAGKR